MPRAVHDVPRNEIVESRAIRKPLAERRQSARCRRSRDRSGRACNGSAHVCSGREQDRIANEQNSIVAEPTPRIKDRLLQSARAIQRAWTVHPARISSTRPIPSSRVEPGPGSSSPRRGAVLSRTESRGRSLLAGRQRSPPPRTPRHFALPRALPSCSERRASPARTTRPRRSRRRTSSAESIAPRLPAPRGSSHAPMPR